MEKPSRYQADRPTTAKGFTLLSVMLTMALISSLTLLALRSFEGIDNEHLFFMNVYLAGQCKALTEREEVTLNSHSVFFWKSGRVDQARTITFGRHKVIIHLGNGYLTYE